MWTAGTTKRLFLLTTALGGCLGLAACTPLAGVVSDAWPSGPAACPRMFRRGRALLGLRRVHGAPAAPGRGPAKCGGEYCGGLPRDDRCGCAGGTAPGTTAVAVPVTTAPGPTAAAPPPAASYPQPPPQAPLPPAYARPDDRSATQGGLY